MKHAHYQKDISHLQTIDVYRVCQLFDVADPCLAHAVKKLLCAGQRGVKTEAQDVQEAIDTLTRYQGMQREDSSQPQPATPARAEELQAGRGAQQSDYPHEEMDSVAKDRYRVTPSSGATFLSYAVNAGDGDQEIYRGRKSDCEAVARRLSGAFLDGGFVAHSIFAASTHPKPADDGWIEWAGGECPVGNGVKVDLRFREGNELLEIDADWRWNHRDTPSDIVAYRLAGSRT